MANPIVVGFNKLRNAAAGFMAADLPTTVTPKAVKPAGIPSFVTSTTKTTSALPKPDKRLANKDLTTFRAGSSTHQVVRDFAAASPDLSAAVFSYLRTGITSGYTAYCKNLDGSFNVEATSLLQQIITRMDVLPNYADGFGGSYSLRSVSESLAKELLLYGGMSAELVLDKTRTPWRIMPIHTPSIEFVVDGNDLTPRQVIAGQTIVLDVPTFFYTSLDQDLLTPYSSSPFESAIRPTIFAQDFIQDLWRVVKQAVHPRMNVKINLKMLSEQIPTDVTFSDDPNAKETWLNNAVAQVTEQINNLQPNQALIYYDFITVERESNNNSSLSSEWKTIQELVNAQVATGAKVLPAVLGHNPGSSNIASTESLLFIKSVTTSIQAKLNEMFSRIFTLSVRLYGLDVVVSFKYNDIEMRPESELESFKAMKQSRILEQLSLGMITDEDASIQITGKLPHAGAPKLSGTGFAAKKAVETPGDDSSNDGSAANKANKSDAPKGGARGSNTKK